MSFHTRIFVSIFSEPVNTLLINICEISVSMDFSQFDCLLRYEFGTNWHDYRGL